MAMVPFLNSAFQMMNTSFYARWYYMLTLMMALAHILSLECSRVDWKRSHLLDHGHHRGHRPGGGLYAHLHPPAPTARRTVTYGLEQYPTRFWTYVAIALISLAALIYLFTFCRTSRRRFQRSAMAALSVVTVLYSIYFIALGKTQSEYTWDHLIPYNLNGGKDVDLPDLQEVPLGLLRKPGQRRHVLGDPHHPGVPQHCARLGDGVSTTPSACSGTWPAAGHLPLRPAGPDLGALAV